MPKRTPDSTESAVIQMWLEGFSRDAIAAKCGISAGAATRIIQDWKQRIGFDVADQLRDLARGLKKLGLSVSECATGFRTHQVLGNLGVKEDDLESFLVGVYDRSRHLGLESQQIAEYLSDLVSFFAKAHSVAIEEGAEAGGRSDIPRLSQISPYIAGMKEEKINLEKEISRLRNEKEAILHEKSALSQKMDNLIAEHRITKEAISWYSQAKSELAEDGYSIGEISELRQAIKFVHDSGYDLSKITRTYSEFGAMRVENRALQYQISKLQEQAKSMEQNNSLLRSRMDSNSHTISVIDELRGIGFGYKNLKRLHNLLLEVGRANGLPPIDDSTAAERFLDDIERDYATVLGFKETIQKLRKEITQLNLEIGVQRGIYNALPHLNSSLGSLLRKGVREDHIVTISNLLEVRPDAIESLLELIDKEDCRHLKIIETSTYVSNSSLGSTSSSSSDQLYSSRSMPQRNDIPETARVGLTQRSANQVTAKSNQNDIYCRLLGIVGVTASGSIDGNEPSNVVGDDFNAVWSHRPIGSWLQLDLGSSVKICRVDIAWGDGDTGRNSFVISVSGDHINFTDKVSMTSESAAPSFDNYSLPEETYGRYVRITLKGAKGNGQGKISKILVFGHSR